MSQGAIGAFEVDRRDVAYVEHDSGPLQARIFTPRGPGPFPLMIEVHGGTWTRGDRHMNGELNEALASSGVVVAALDFRMPPVAGYPASLADINYAVRWLKSHAAELECDPARVGAMGTSSGAHQVAVCALRPREPRYAALALDSGAAPEPDARLGCLVLCWPVIDPITRYRNMKKLKAAGPPYPAFIDNLLPPHDLYWPGEEAMEEATPARILEDGEHEDLPPTICFQAEGDQAHSGSDLDRFSRLYRSAGGEIATELFHVDGASIDHNRGASRGLPYRTTLDRLVGSERERVFGKLAAFVHRHLH